MQTNVKRLTVIAGMMALAVGMMGGCSREESPLGSPAFSTKRPGQLPMDFSDDLDRNSAEDRDQRIITIAYASDEALSTPQAPFPVLYLLHDYLGDDGYYERFSLQALIDEMYARGEIGRMLVVTVDASNYFGGSYYRNSGTTGNYGDMLHSMIRMVEGNFRVHSRAGSAARAIGGHGMGGYGAMRFALDHPELFSSVSSISGPLSLGNPNEETGIWNPQNGLIKTVFTQNGTGEGDANLYSRLKAGAFTHYETGELFAMASAFSAHPLRVYDSTGIKLVPQFPFTGRFDTIYSYDFFSGRPEGANTVAFDSRVDTFGVGVDLPFDSFGNPTEEIWAKWSDSADVKTVFQAKRQSNPAFWNDMEIYFDVGQDNELGFLEMNRDFHQVLTQAGVPHIYEEYQASSGQPAGHSNQLFMRLKKVLVFHSERLERPDGPTRQ